MSLSVEVYAVRDMASQLDPMIQVVQACTAANVSYPPEMVDFFGDTWEKCGPDPDQLRYAMQNIRVALAGELDSSDGASIQLDGLPEGTHALRIVTAQCGESSAPQPVAASAPADLPVASAVVEEAPVLPSAIPVAEPQPAPEIAPPIAAAIELAPAPIELPIDVPDDIDDEEGLDLDAPTDVYNETPPEPAPVLGEPQPEVNASDVLDLPNDLSAIDAIRNEENRVIDMDKTDDLVLAVEDDLLDIDDLDDPLELDEPAERL